MAASAMPAAAVAVRLVQGLGDDSLPGCPDCGHGHSFRRYGDRGRATGFRQRSHRYRYRDRYREVNETINAAHIEGQLTAEIIADPEKFVDLDPDLPQTLLDLKQAGKKLFLATNSEWHYTRAMMRYAFNGRLGSIGWRDLFDLVIVEAKKPAFFERNAPFVEVVDDDGNEQPLQGPLRQGVIYRGGNAEAVQQHLDMDGSEILYVGDHVYADVHVSSRIRRWRAALILRELEEEVLGEQLFGVEQRQLEELMRDKVALDEEQAALRNSLKRLDHDQPLPHGVPASQGALQERLRELRQQIGPRLSQAHRSDPRWRERPRPRRTPRPSPSITCRVQWPSEPQE